MIEQVIEVTDKLWKKTNPESKMSPPSMVYEMMERHYKTWGILFKRHPEVTFEEFAETLVMTDLSKEQAEKGISWGYKLTHRSFMNNEFITLAKKSANHYLDENDNLINKKQFWRYRTKEVWSTGWSLYKPEKK